LYSLYENLTRNDLENLK